MTPPMTIAHSGGAEGGFRSEGAPGGAVHGPLLRKIPKNSKKFQKIPKKFQKNSKNPPPPPGRPRGPDRTRTPGGSAPEGGQGRGPRAAPQRGSREAAARPPPPPPLPARKPRGRQPPPPEAGGMVPPPPARERSRSTARLPAPAAGSHTNRGEQASPRQRARTPHRSRPEKAGEHKPEWYGDHAPHDENNASDSPFVPAQGRQRDRTRQSDPPPYWPPRPHKQGARRTGRPPPPPQTRPPAQERHGPAPRGAHSPEPGRGVRGPDRPPQARQTEQATRAGHAEGHGPRGTALPAPSAVTTRGAHATPPRWGGKRTPRERERIHTQRARGDYQKGNRTELVERTDRVDWRTSGRG